MKSLFRHSLAWPAVTLILLLGLNAVMNPGFLALAWRDGHLYGSLVDILNRAAPLALVSAGMTLVIAARGLDISVGAVVAISAAVAAVIIGPTGNLGFAIAGALGVALLCGIWNGALVVGVGMQPIIATLILMVAGRGVAQLITGGQILTVYYAPYDFIGNGYLLGLPFAALLAGAVIVLLHVLLSVTPLGLFIRAIGINPVASRIAGVRAQPITLCLYAFGGLMAGLAGLIISSNVKSADANNAGQLLELDAILAVTLGGTALTGGKFSLAGTVLGALIIQTLTSTIYSLGVPPEVNLVFKAALIFLVMLLQSPDFRATFKRLPVRPPGAEKTS
ncbi:MAG TPA: ABC transporter permease [Steroidobacteraceae bacterium]|nr:ABC transporter permease [Steroidobacteraceae bacterium]